MKSNLKIEQDISTIIYEDQIDPAAMSYLGEWRGFVMYFAAGTKKYAMSSDI